MTARVFRRVPIALTAVVSLAVMVLAYAVTPPDRWSRALVADLSWLWSAGLAATACTIAWRRATAPHLRATWQWFSLGAIAFLLGQLYWTYRELILGTAPSFPSLADVGYLGVYPCFILAVRSLLREEPRLSTDPGTAIDATLITFTAGALTYEFLLDPLLTGGRGGAGLVVSVAWSVGGVAVLWVLAVQTLRRTTFPLATAGLGTLGLTVFCVSNVIYAFVAFRGTYQTGHWLDLGWDAGFLMIAIAAARAPATAVPGEGSPSRAAFVARMIALLLGLAGVGALAVRAALVQPEADLAVLSAVGIAIIAARMVHSLRADRRYAAVLETEVAHQTRSLMDSLATAAAAERNLRVVMEAVPDAIVVLDRNGRILDLNPMSRTMVAAPGPLAGRQVFDFLEPDAARVARRNLDAAFEGEVRRFETPFVRDDQTRGVSAVLYAPIREAGRVTRVLALARDITDQRRTETQLQQAEKLAALGQLVSGVAHEINNPAAIISGFAQTLMLDELTPDQREMVNMVYDEATRIGRITSNLLAFARAGGRDRTLVDLNEMVRRTFALRSYHLSTLNIAVNLELDPEEPHVWGNGSELQQMILNLLVNAEHALTLVDRGRAITLHTTASDQDVRFICADTGPGIAPEIRAKIFDPFFTTKPEGLGTGLGLSICYGIVNDHGGRISVDSELDCGARFVVTLPRDPRTESRPAPTSTRVAETGSLSVLLVDDEMGLRKAVARYLNRRGMKVRAVREGEEALAALRQEEFDIIVSDVRMPGLSGREFLDRLRAERPDLVPRLIFTTGDTFAPETSALLREFGVPTIVKPFDFAALEQLMQHVAAAARTVA